MLITESLLKFLLSTKPYSPIAAQRNANSRNTKRRYQVYGLYRHEA